MASPASLLSEDVRLLQQADGVLLAVGGGEGQQVGGLRTRGQIKGVDMLSTLRSPFSTWGEAHFLAAAGEVGENGGDDAILHS